MCDLVVDKFIEVSVESFQSLVDIIMIVVIGK